MGRQHFDHDALIRFLTGFFLAESGMKIAADYLTKGLVSHWGFSRRLVLCFFIYKRVNRFIPMENSDTHHFFLAVLGLMIPFSFLMALSKTKPRH
jgi:hypothetical protein